MQKLRRGVFWTLGALLVIAALLRLFVFEVWTMPDDAFQGAQAAPTLAGGDTLILLRRGTPGFGELVRCTDPVNAQLFVVGRIAGVEGDTVELEGRKLLVNGHGYEGDSACAEPKLWVKHPETLKDIELGCDVVQMGGSWHYRAGLVQPTFEEKKSMTVKPGMLFLVSDNRAMHDDSRDYGLVLRDTCKERVVFRLWSKAGWSDEKTRTSYIR
jgi:signal peptidase I